MDGLQKDKLRSVLISYKANKKLPWKSIIHAILMSKETSNCYPEDGSASDFQEEALRRFANGESESTEDKRQDIKAFLIEKRFLTEAEFYRRTYDLEEMKTVHSYLANDNEEAKKKLEYSEGTYISKREEHGVVEKSTLVLKLDSSGIFLHAEDKYEVLPQEEEGLSLDKEKPELKPCHQNRIGFGFATTSENRISIFLRGETRDDTVIYMESGAIASLSTERLALYRHGIHDISQLELRELRAKENSLYNVFHVQDDEIYKKKMVGKNMLLDIPTVSRDKQIEYKNRSFIDAAKRCDDEWLQKLMQSGADINTQDKDGMTALHYAAAYGAQTCLRVLLESNDCNFLLKNNNGNYASDLAMLWAKDYVTCELLNEKQAMQAYAGN